MITAQVTPTIARLADESIPTIDAAKLEAPRELPGMMDLILRGQARLSAILTVERHQPGAIKKLLVLSMAGLLVHGIVVGVVTQFLRAQSTSELAVFTAGTPVLWMPPAFVLAFLGALSICLPSFYFYTQIAGLDASFRLVTAQALRAQATVSVLLFGVLPIYFALALAAVLGVAVDADTVIASGLVLPFIVGLHGVRAVYRGFNDMLASLPITHVRRGNFIRRLVLAWGAVYTTVAPVALYRLAVELSAVL